MITTDQNELRTLYIRSTTFSASIQQEYESGRLSTWNPKGGLAGEILYAGLNTDFDPLNWKKDAWQRDKQKFREVAVRLWYRGFMDLKTDLPNWTWRTNSAGLAHMRTMNWRNFRTADPMDLIKIRLIIQK